MPTIESMKRSLLILVAMFGCAPESSVQAPVLSSRYDALFVASGERHHVPPQVLAVTAQALTRTEMVDGDGEWGRPTFGVMAIPAELISETDALARTDVAANIDFAARLLSARATEMQIDRTDLRAWSAVITNYARVDDPSFLRDEVLKPLGVLRDEDLQRVIKQALSPDYDLGIWRPSPNFNSRSGRTPQFVIIHTCEGGYSGCWGWQTNPASQVSAHYTVSDGSEVTQLVRESDRAWHVAATYQCANNNGVRCDLNGISTNTIAVGIEHAGYASMSSFPGSQIDASARLVCSITRNWGIPRDRNHILSHGQLQPNNRTDPGPNWPWDAFIYKVQEVCGDHPPPCDRTAGPFTFSCDGPQPAQTCVNLNEPSDPDTWTDNFLCSANDYGFRWSYTGPIEDMDCTNVSEASEPLASVWSDNFFCAPKQSPWIVSYSSAGPIDGKTCVHLNETVDLANSWGDNFLCFEPRTVFQEGEFSFAMTGAPADRNCINVATNDPDTWNDNWFCSVRDFGLTWSTTGAQEGKQCVAITETADATPDAWTNTYLCAPEGTPYRFTWSSAGPLEHHQCLRWFDHAESTTWLDNWLCFTPDAPPPAPRLMPGATVDAPTDQPASQLPFTDPQMVRGGCSTGIGAAFSLAVLLLARRRRR